VLYEEKPEIGGRDDELSYAMVDGKKSSWEGSSKQRIYSISKEGTPSAKEDM
jgi:hypothetical protein